MRNDNLTDAQRMFIHTVMFKQGIVPMENIMMDVRRALEGLDPETARKFKRKFRKLWRKHLKSKAATSNPFKRVSLGEKGKPPTRKQKLERKRLVSADLQPEVDAMIHKFKDLRGGSPGDGTRQS